MPSTKTDNYSKSYIDNSRIGRALGHPARIRIIEIIQDQTIVRNTDLIKYLQLSQPSVSNHINKLAEANLIESTFLANSSTLISLSRGAEEKVKDFVNGLFD